MRSVLELTTQCNTPGIQGSHQRRASQPQRLTPAIWSVGSIRGLPHALQQQSVTLCTSSQCMARKSARSDEQQQKPPPAQARALSDITISEKKHLVVRQLLGSDIFEVDGVLTAAECKQFVAAADTAGFRHQTSRGPRFGEALRENGRLQLQDEALAQRLWLGSGLSQVFQGFEANGQRATGLNANLRLYRYTPGQHFGRHLDDSVEACPGQWTMYTLLIYLSDGLSGGETVFYGERGRKVASVTPKVGKALLHLHGDDCLEHESVAISKGTKYILRSDVVFS